MSRCVDIPLSWWALERYNIGEVSFSERASLAAHLESCPHCRARLRVISEDRRLPPALEIAAPATTASIWLPLFQSKAAAAALVASALLLAGLLIWPLTETTRVRAPLGVVSERGGEPVLTVVREREGVVIRNPDRYAPGDRFRLELTLPGTKSREWDAVVFQDEEVFFPSRETPPLGPGNHRALPGVFRVTGEAPVTICVLLGPERPTRPELEREGKGALPGDAICRTLHAQATETP